MKRDLPAVRHIRSTFPLGGVEIDLRGGKPPDTCVASQLQHLAGAAIRSLRGISGLGSTWRAGKRSDGVAAWQSQHPL